MNLTNIKLNKRSHKGKISYCAFIDIKLKTQNSAMVLEIRMVVPLGGQ